MNDFFNMPYGVYIRADEANRITAINSDAFLADLTGWSKIDEGHGDKYHHAQGNYFGEPITDERGVYRYAYVPDGDVKWRERTQEEMDADYVPPKPVVSTEQRMDEIEAALIELAALYAGGDA